MKKKNYNYVITDSPPFSVIQHFLREQVAEKNIRVEYVGTKEQVEDIFTKPLPQESFEYLRQRLGVISTPKWILFEWLSYMSYMYMRKHHKEYNSFRGSNPGWKDIFAIDDKGGEIYQMQRTEAWFQGEYEWYDFSIASEYHFI